MFNVGIVAANYNRLFLQLKIVDTLKLGNKYRLWMHITFFRRQPESLYHTTVVCIKVRTASFPRFWKNHP